MALLPSVGTAQNVLPSITDVMADVADTEVYVTGALGMGSLTPVTDFWLVLEDGTELPVTFELANPLGRRLEGCFYSPSRGGTPCAITGSGYVTWDGATLQLTLTAIETIASSKELP